MAAMTLRVEGTKTGEPLEFPVTRQVAAILKRRLAECEGFPENSRSQVFSSEVSKSGHLEGMRHLNARIGEVGGSRFWFHALRNCFITFADRHLMLPAGLTKWLVNHARPQDVTEGHAADWTMEQLREAGHSAMTFGRELMKFIVWLAVGLAALTLFTSPSAAEPVPEHAAGVWSLSGCGYDGLTVLVNPSAALVIESEGAKTKVALAAAEFVAESLVLTIKGEEGELVLPPLGNFERCQVLPGLLPVLFAEAVAVFRRLHEIDALCYGDGGIDARCVAVAFSIIDLTGDGRFSRAELSRAVRAAGFFIGHRLVADEKSVSFVSLEDMYVAQLAASALGPFVAGNLVDSYDYDGDGFLSLGELMQDRSPEEGVEGVLASIASAMAPEALSALMKSMTGMLGLLR